MHCILGGDLAVWEVAKERDAKYSELPSKIDVEIWLPETHYKSWLNQQGIKKEMTLEQRSFAFPLSCIVILCPALK